MHTRAPGLRSRSVFTFQFIGAAPRLSRVAIDRGLYNHAVASWIACREPNSQLPVVTRHHCPRAQDQICRCWRMVIPVTISTGAEVLEGPPRVNG